MIIVKLTSVPRFKGDENRQHDSEAQQRRASVTHERKGDADYRHDSDSHADVYEKMHEEAAGNAIAVNPGECVLAFFCK